MPNLILTPIQDDPRFTPQMIERVADALHAEALATDDHLRRVALFVTSSTIRMRPLMAKHSPGEFVEALARARIYAQEQLEALKVGPH